MILFPRRRGCFVMSCENLYWLILFLGGPVYLLRYGERVTQERIGLAKEDIRLLYYIKTKKADISAEQERDLLSHANLFLKSMAPLVREGVKYNIYAGLLILFMQAIFIFFEVEAEPGLNTLWNWGFAVSLASVIFCAFHSMWVLRTLREKEKNLLNQLDAMIIMIKNWTGMPSATNPAALAASVEGPGSGGSPPIGDP